MSEFGEAAARVKFERAFVATRFMLNSAGDPIRGLITRTMDARRVGVALANGGKQERALVLAAEWGKVIVALLRRGILRDKAR